MRLLLIFLVLSPICTTLAGELDDFSSLDRWRVVASDGVKAEIRAFEGEDGRGLRLEYDFTRGAGFCVLRHELPMDLPAEYRFGFQIRGESPPNNLEFKLIDPSGENVWWVNQRAFEFPSDWKKITLRSRKFSFAWGPSGGKAPLAKLGAIEIAIAASSGGKGTIDLDQLTFEAIPPRGEPRPIRVSFGQASNGKPDWAELPADWKINGYIQTTGVGWAQPTRAATTESPAQSQPTTSTEPRPQTHPTTSPPSTAQTRWAEPTLQPMIALDLGGVREFGGLIIDWDETHHPDDLDVEASLDGANFETVAQMRGMRGGRRYIQIPDGEAAYLRVRILSAAQAPAAEPPGQSPAATEPQAQARGAGISEPQAQARGAGISEPQAQARGASAVRLSRLELAPPEFGQSANAMWSRIARDAPRGWYPRYFLGEQQPWTVIGVEGDDDEALMDAAGAIELGKGGPRLEPFLRVDGRFVTWANVECVQELRDSMPCVVWRFDQFSLEITTHTTRGYSDNELKARYRFQAAEPGHEVTLFLAIRPFQVLPPWHELNLTGGAASFRGLALFDGQIRAGSYRLIPSHRWQFGWSGPDAGDIVEFLADGRLPESDHRADTQRRTSAAMEIRIGAGHVGYSFAEVTIPFQKLNNGPGTALSNPPTTEPASLPPFRPRVTLRLPESAARIVETFNAQQHYILINADGPRIQPGSRTYERSWIRDGALTGTALLVTGHGEKLRDFLDWYAPYQYPSGKIPCVVDSRGPDPVPENDSHGEYIYGVATYYRFSHDREFLNRHFPRVVKAVEYIETLRAQRMTDEFKSGPVEKRMLYGLVPESISHEGYSAKPMHSYWDGFFTLRGLSDAANLAGEMVGWAQPTTAPSTETTSQPRWAEPTLRAPRNGLETRPTNDGLQTRPTNDGLETRPTQTRPADFSTKWQSLADDYRKCMYDSMRLTMDLHKIDYIPGCAELGDFDATSTAIGVFPCNERGRAPEPQLTNTFDRYLKFFRDRRDGRIEWREFTPYELRLVGVFVRLGRVEEAHELLDWFMQYQQPAGWRQWGEVAYRDPLYPGFVGDMPHTWVGGEFVNSVRAMLVYEDENADALVVAAGIPWRWLNSPEGVAFDNFPTEYGPLSASLKLENGNALRVRMSALVRPPAGGIVLKLPRKPLKIEFPSQSTRFELRPESIWLQQACQEMVIHVQE